MTSEDQQGSSAVPEASGLSRRGLLRSAAGLGIAGVAAGLLIETTNSTASAATAPDGQALPANGAPLVAHVQDTRTGDVDFFAGEKHVRVHNPALAQALAHAVATGR